MELDVYGASSAGRVEDLAAFDRVVLYDSGRGSRGLECRRGKAATATETAAPPRLRQELLDELGEGRGNPPVTPSNNSWVIEFEDLEDASRRFIPSSSSAVGGHHRLAQRRALTQLHVQC